MLLLNTVVKIMVLYYVTFLTLMKTFLPAMLYRPSPTFFTLSSLEHLPDEQLQPRSIRRVTSCTCDTIKTLNCCLSSSFLMLKSNNSYGLSPRT